MRTFYWTLPTLLFACADPKPEESPEVMHVWAGWNHSWEQLSHRVSFIRAIATPQGGLQMGIRGGDWSTGDTFSDEANYRMQIQEVSGGDLHIVHGETSLTVGPDGSAQVAETAGVTGEHVAVVLRGFEIETDIEQDADYPDYDPALGYTSRGFGMGVSTVDLDGATPSFQVQAQVGWGPRDRDDMNAALLLANTQVRVAWTAIGYSGSEQRVSLWDAVDLTHTPPWSEQSGLTLETGLSGGPGIVGITAFNLGVRDQDGGDGGDYLRSFGVEPAVTETGDAPSTVETEVLTTSAIELGTMRFEPEIDLIWITPESSNLQVRPIIHAGSHPVGTIEISPEG